MTATDRMADEYGSLRKFGREKGQSYKTGDYGTVWPILLLITWYPVVPRQQSHTKNENARFASQKHLRHSIMFLNNSPKMRHYV